MTELDEAIERAKKECEEMDMNNEGLSIVERMTPYTKYTNLLWIKLNYNYGKKERRTNDRSSENQITTHP
jgi:hypothetical protein